jgi:hypothetical protein
MKHLIVTVLALLCGVTRSSGQMLTPVQSWASGKLTINSGAPFPGARIQFISKTTGQPFAAFADGNGDYSVALPPDHYRVTVAGPGAITLESSDIVRSGDMLHRDVMLLPLPLGEQEMTQTEMPFRNAIAAGQNCLSWCWAASAAMLAISQGVSIPQEVFVARIFGSPPPCVPAPNLQTIAVALTGTYQTVDGPVQLSAGFLNSLPPASEFVESLRDARPIIIGDRTHARVAVGVFWHQTPAGPQVWSILTIDPFFTFGAPLNHVFDFSTPNAAISSGANQITGVVMIRVQHLQ